MSGDRVEYSVAPWLAMALLAACAATGVLATRTDGPGRFLIGVLAVVTGVEALRSALFRPVLAADDRGIEAVAGVRRQRIPWEAVVAVTPMSPLNAGGRRRRVAALEIDLGDRLVVVPAYRLGAPVAEVVSRITSVTTGRTGSG